jgi:hypothetical protein
MRTDYFHIAAFRYYHGTGTAESVATDLNRSGFPLNNESIDRE